MRVQLFPKNIYSYLDENGEEQIGIYLGDTDVKPFVLIAKLVEPEATSKYITINNLNKVYILGTYEKINKYKIQRQLHLKGKEVIATPYEFDLITKSIVDKLLIEFGAKCNTTVGSNLIDGKLNDITLTEQMLKHLEWSITKEDIKFSKYKSKLDIVQYRIYFAYIGNNIGSEINKLRPVLVWKEHVNQENKEDSSYFVFPITSKIPKKNYYYNIKKIIDGKTNIIKLNDGKRISIKRFVKPLIDKNTQLTIELTEEEIQKIKESLKKYFMI